MENAPASPARNGSNSSPPRSFSAASGGTAGLRGKFSLTNGAERFMLTALLRGFDFEMKSSIGIIIPIIIDIIGIRPGGVGG